MKVDIDRKEKGRMCIRPDKDIPLINWDCPLKYYRATD